MRKHILICEDDPFFAWMCAKTISNPERKVQVATNGKQAIAMMEKRAPDLLILDLLLPVSDGYSVLEFLRSCQSTFPVIVFSNLDDDRLRLNEKLPVVAYCVKSETSLDEFGQMVNDCLTPSFQK